MRTLLQSFPVLTKCDVCILVLSSCLTLLYFSPVALFSHWEEYKPFQEEETVPVISTWWSILEGQKFVLIFVMFTYKYEIKLIVLFLCIKPGSEFFLLKLVSTELKKNVWKAPVAFQVLCSDFCNLGYVIKIYFCWC